MYMHFIRQRNNVNNMKTLNFAKGICLNNIENAVDNQDTCKIDVNKTFWQVMGRVMGKKKVL